MFKLPSSCLSCAIFPAFPRVDSTLHSRSQFPELLVRSDCRVHARASRNFPSVPRGFFFTQFSFVSGKWFVVRQDFNSNPCIVSFSGFHQSTRLCRFWFFNLGNCRSFNSPPPRKDYHHKSRDLYVDVVYMIGVNNHSFLEECCYGRYLLFPVIERCDIACVSAQRFCTNRVYTFEGVFPIPFHIGVSVIRVRYSSRGVYRHAFQEAGLPGRALRACLTRSHTKSGTPNTCVRETWQGRGSGPSTISVVLLRSTPDRCTRPNHHMRMRHDTFIVRFSSPRDKPGTRIVEAIVLQGRVFARPATNQ